MPSLRPQRPKDTGTVVTSIKLDAKLYKRLRQRALDEGRAARLLVEDAIRAYLAEVR